MYGTDEGFAAWLAAQGLTLPDGAKKWTLSRGNFSIRRTPGAVIDLTVFQNSGSEIAIADNATFQIELYTTN